MQNNKDQATYKQIRCCYALGHQLELNNCELVIFLGKYGLENFKSFNKVEISEVIEHLEHCKQNMSKAQINDIVIAEQKKMGIYQLSFLEGKEHEQNNN